jgi:hypothetical protein
MTLIRSPHFAGGPAVLLGGWVAPVTRFDTVRPRKNTMPRCKRIHRLTRLFRRAERYLRCGNRRRLFYLLHRSPELLSHFEGYGSLLHLAGWWRHYDVVQWMLEEGANPDVAACFNTLLSHAAAENDVHLARMLLDHGADIEKANDRFETPLGFACSYNAIDVVKLLCERGADVNRTEGWGHSYLYWVQCGQKTEIEAILVSYGARLIEEEPKLSR